MNTSTIRRRFLDYFGRHDHRVVPSSSLVPANDPTLYFVNAGMVQFKDVFSGEESRDYVRACSAQKCLRVSGKHNDLETVGRTPKHHTFFEMLGNFSFGDYFKREAIIRAWAFLTEEMGLPADRMVATVYCGEADVPPDEEAYAVWRDEVGLPEKRIYRLGKEDNFWAMGDIGPCGPCSEIHLLQDPSIVIDDALAAGGPAVDARWVEVWNLVFMQFNRGSDGVLKPLQQTGVDTGMGLERLAALVNGLPSTYDTDLLRPLIARASELSGCPYGEGTDTDVSMRVIADHARATAFCIADGVFPEKGGREYVLRRIMRRAIRHGELLGLHEPFFHEICATVVELMGADYPELADRAQTIDKLVHAEEAAFRRTLQRGLQRLQQVMDGAHEQQRTELDVAFVGDLYATAGFPIDLTRLIAQEAGLHVDEEAAHRWVIATHGAGDTKVGDAAVAAVYKNLGERLGATAFCGYGEAEATSEVLALVREGQIADRVGVEEAVELVVARSPFYGRAGGQVGDTGVVRGPHGHVEITDTVRVGPGLLMHRGKVVEGSLAQGEQVALQIDVQRRQSIRLNHSATHLLHHALREVLGPHVAQKGSEVAPAQLRFDFSHFEALTREETRRVEQLVNDEIRRNQPSRTEVRSYEEARQAGAMALFGEKYGDRVRVVRIGGQSVELCGGTHVERAGDIGLFRVIGDESLALGVRRIVAVTGQAALALDQQMEEQLRAAAGLLRVGRDKVAERADKLLGQLKAQEREIAALKRQLATGAGRADPLDGVAHVDGIPVLAMRSEAGDPKTLRDAGDALRDRLGSGLLIIGGEHEGKARLLVMVTKDLTGRLHAGKLVAELAKVVGGRGGGRPDMAQAGGPAVEKLDEALQQVVPLVERMVGVGPERAGGAGA